MHKLKATIAELRTYLGRDERGLQLLDEVSRVANGVRKSAAAAKQDAETARSALTVSQGNVTKENRRATELRRQLDRQRSVCVQKKQDIKALEAKIAALEAQVAELTPPDFEVPERVEVALMHGDDPGLPPEELHPLVRSIKPYVRMLNNLRGKMRTAPAPGWAFKKQKTERYKFGSLLVYNLPTIIKDLSNPELLKLGQFVAGIALMNFPCCVDSQYNFPDAREFGGLEYTDRQLQCFLRWFRTNISVNPTAPGKALMSGPKA